MHADTPGLNVRLPRASPFLGAWTRALPPALAVVGAGSVFAAVSALAPRDAWLATLLLDRGFTQPLTLALFFWGLGHVVRRLLVQRGERDALAWCRALMREGFDRERVPAMSGALHAVRDSLSAPVLGAVLAYFRGPRPTRDEVLEVASQQMDRAWDRVEGEYKALSAVMWLLPLTGFLGTVVGMAQAIEGFDAVVVGGLTDLQALTPTVAGLATAFDTTLLALVLVLPLKVFEVGLEGRDGRLLDRIDATVGTGLVRHLDLGVLAQQSPEEQALARVNESAERLERNLRRVDEALARVAARLAETAGLAEGLDEVVEAARVTCRTLPRLHDEVRALRALGEQPIALVRGGARHEPTRVDRPLLAPGAFDPEDP